MKAIYVEANATPDARVVYRWCCRACGLNGNWLMWLSDAEADGERHRKQDHNDAQVRA